ncbi:hypothetical protein [Parendozoicomonas haliclonae]|uniref:DUF2157 domain-containing protein n=1 Tax=Parendozoicomonas haliclonae TaxID=1960125 RepID=A0A1X7AJA9_9GAMM|nr:hypothetical protein [Parendozoicomonas haliclonae]SMA46356.1 hypothetical protein EHSB41UT_02152 [Parendozoicomonas haliclonae]
MVKKTVLEQAVENGLLQPSQVDPLYNYLQEHSSSRFNLTHVLYYFGGFVAIGALTLFMNLGWEQFGGWGIVGICAVYLCVAALLMQCMNRLHYDVPASLCGLFIVALIPLAVYGGQQALGMWPEDKNFQNLRFGFDDLTIMMEGTALLAGVLVLSVYRRPLQTLPITLALWFLSLSVTSLVYGEEFDWGNRSLVTMWFGLAMVLVAFGTDIATRKSRDYAFWFYLVGVVTFWGGLTSQSSDSELSKFFYFCLNLGLIGCGVVLLRKIFVIAGAAGSFIYLMHMADRVFKDSWLFPVALTIAGLGIVWLGILWQKHEQQISASLQSRLPKVLQELLVQRRN